MAHFSIADTRQLIRAFRMQPILWVQSDVANVGQYPRRTGRTAVAWDMVGTALAGFTPATMRRKMSTLLDTWQSLDAEERRGWIFGEDFYFLDEYIGARNLMQENGVRLLDQYITRTGEVFFEVMFESFRMHATYKTGLSPDDELGIVVLLESHEQFVGGPIFYRTLFQAHQPSEETVEGANGSVDGIGAPRN